MKSAWLKDLRALGQKEFNEKGIPNQNEDYWRATPLPQRVEKFLKQEIASLDISYEGGDGAKIYNLKEIYENGAAPDWLINLQSRPSKEPLWSLCNAHLRDGLALDLPDGFTMEKPMVITMTGHNAGFIVPRTAMRLGSGSSFTLIEHHKGSGEFWNNRLSQVVVGKGAHMNHIRFQEYSSESTYTQITDVEVKEGGTYSAFNFVIGAGLSRQKLYVDLCGENACANIGALSLLGGNQIGDQTIQITHNAPNCTSSQSAGFILGGKSKGVFQGKVTVDRIAQKTNANQLSRAILLSDDAKMHTMPELEIEADDVQCAHGATCGAIDENALFYLRSRGINKTAAKNLILKGFACEFLKNLGNEAIEKQIQNKAEAWLAKQTA